MTKKSNILKANLDQAYNVHHMSLRVNYARIGCILSLVLMPAGVLLDLFVYPHLLIHFLIIRVLCDSVTAGIFLSTYTRQGRQNIIFVGLLIVLVANLSISLMIYISEGAVSPYYAGLNLVILGMGVLLPWTFKENFFVCIMTLVLYLGACLCHQKIPIEWNTLFNNLYFLILTSTICITASYYISRRRFDEFRLRYELDIRNKEIARSYEQLEELDRLKSEFFANVSHELRTPLTLIISPIQEILAKKTGISDDVKESMNLANRNALRLLKLINDLLEIVRFEEDGGKIERSKINLTLFLPGLADSVRHLANYKGLNLDVKGEKEDLIIWSDQSHFERVLLNLLTNAIKFTPSGGSITISFYREEDRVVIEIQDTGIGISEKDIPYIFDRFRQVDGSSKRKFKGMGLGLSLAKALIEELNGSISVTSKVDQGTTFRIEFPLASGLPESTQTREDRLDERDPIAKIQNMSDRTIIDEPEDQTLEKSMTGTGRFKLLVIEDEHDMRQFLCSTLSEGHLVFRASDGETGLNLLHIHHPDLVLLDLMLPGMDGLEVCKKIKRGKDTRRIKVILLTARIDEKLKISALEMGADDFLTKPFSSTEIKLRIKNLLRASELEEHLRSRNIELENTLQRLRETEAQLIQSEKMSALGNIAAGILHEINNPLNFMLTALQVAEEQIHELNPEIREMMKDIGEGMDRIRNIVLSLRTFAHPGTANEWQQFYLSEVVQPAFHLIAHELEGLSVSQNLTINRPVLGSKNLITHVIMNLTVNAARALKNIPSDRTPEIRIKDRIEKDRLYIDVWDNGEGIKKSNLNKVFDPFFTTREVGEGMGLGLSICHTIIKNHGGKMTINSIEGKWTEITFDLSLATTEV